jgi:glycosyltransferase involved in cell wall biosynthesis
MTLVSIVMPAHNEAEVLESSVRAVVSGMRDRRGTFELIVAENGSSDDTAAIAAKLVDEMPEVRAISLPDPDYGRALRAGFLAATGDVVVNFDADFFDLSFLDRAVASVAAGDAVIVVGTKRGAGALDTRAPARRIVTTVFSTILQRGFGLHVSDTHGIKAMSRAPLVALAEQCRFGADLFDTELILRAERAGLRTAEIPVVVRELRPPRSSIARRVPRTLAGLARLWLMLRVGREPR